MRQLKPCLCGCREGWYEKRLTQREQYYDENGIAWNSIELNERGGKRKYCSSCGRDITRRIGVTGKEEK